MKNLFHFQNSDSSTFVYQQQPESNDSSAEATNKIENPFPSSDFKVDATQKSLAALQKYQIMFHGKSLIICGKKIADFGQDTKSFEVYLDQSAKNKGAIVISCKNKNGAKQEISINNGVLSVDGKPCAKLQTPIGAVMPIPKNSSSLQMQSISANLVPHFKEFAKQGYSLAEGANKDLDINVISPNGKVIGKINAISFTWDKDALAIMQKHSAQ